MHFGLRVAPCTELGSGLRGLYPIRYADMSKWSCGGLPGQHGIKQRAGDSVELRRITQTILVSPPLVCSVRGLFPK